MRFHLLDLVEKDVRLMHRWPHYSGWYIDGPVESISPLVKEQRYAFLK